MGCDTLESEEQLFLQKKVQLLGKNPQDIGCGIERVGTQSE